jgi:hypothetical protein
MSDQYDPFANRGEALSDEEWRWLASRPYPMAPEIVERFGGDYPKLVAAFNALMSAHDDRQIAPRTLGHLENLIRAARAYYDMLDADAEGGDDLLDAIIEVRAWRAGLLGYLSPDFFLKRKLDSGPSYFLSDGTRIRPPRK